MSIGPADPESPRALPGVGDFIGEVFELAADRWKPVSVLALILGGPAVVLVVAAVAIGFAVTDDAGNLAPSWKVTAAVLGLVGLGLLFLFSVALAHQMVVGHQRRFGQPSDQFAGELAPSPSWQDSLRVIRTRSGPILGAVFLLGLPVAAAVAVPVLLRSTAWPLRVSSILAAIAVIFWGWVKGSFIAVVGLGDRGPWEILKASAAVSANQFWPVGGRLLLAGLCVWAIGVTASAVLGLFRAALPGGAGMGVVPLLGLVLLVVQLAVVVSGQAALAGRSSAAPGMQDD